METAQQQVGELEGEVDLVVALTHIGLEQDRELAAQVEGIDLIVGGHSHTRMTEYERVGDTIIVQAGSYGRQLGLWEVTVDDGSISEMTGGLVDLWPDDLPHPASEQVSGLVAEWQNRIDETFALSVGSLEGDLMRKPGPESTMGMWATDMVRVGAQADIGMYNAGGLRADLLAGPLTRGDVYQVFPFSNKLVRFELTGAELVGLLLRGANAQLKGHRPLLWSGVRFEWAEVGGAPDLRSVHIGGKPLELEASYTIGTNSYVAQQWEHLLGVEPRALMAFEESVFESAVRFASEGPVSIPHDPRNVFVQQ